jgi:hypothetical protein
MDGGFVVVGYTKSFGAGGNDVYLVRVDSTGDTLWTRTYGGSGWDYGYSVDETMDGGFVVAGYSNSFGSGSYDVYLVRVDSEGDTLWTETYGGLGGDYGYSVQQIMDGGLIVTGWTNSFGAGGADAYLIRIERAIYVRIPDTLGHAYAPIGIPMMAFDNVIGSDIIHCMGTISFDPFILQLDSLLLGSIAPNWNLTWQIESPGTLSFSMLSTGDPLMGSGDLLWMYFTPQDTGYSVIAIDTILLNFGTIPTVAFDGGITVLYPPTYLWLSYQSNGDDPPNDTFFVSYLDTVDFYAVGTAIGCVNTISFNLSYDPQSAEYQSSLFQYWLPSEWDVIDMGSEPGGSGLIKNFAADSVEPFNPIWCSGETLTLFKVSFIFTHPTVLDTATFGDLGLFMGLSNGYTVYPQWGGPYTILFAGDATGDGVINSFDLVFLFSYFFAGGPPPEPLILGDEDGNCEVNPVDIVYLANYLFNGGPAPQPCQNYRGKITVSKSKRLLEELLRSGKSLKKIQEKVDRDSKIK